MAGPSFFGSGLMSGAATGVQQAIQTYQKAKALQIQQQEANIKGYAEFGKMLDTFDTDTLKAMWPSVAKSMFNTDPSDQATKALYYQMADGSSQLGSGMRDALNNVAGDPNGPGAKLVAAIPLPTMMKMAKDPTKLTAFVQSLNDMKMQSQAAKDLGIMTGDTPGTAGQPPPQATAPPPGGMPLAPAAAAPAASTPGATMPTLNGTGARSSFALGAGGPQGTLQSNLNSAGGGAQSAAPAPFRGVGSTQSVEQRGPIVLAGATQLAETPQAAANRLTAMRNRGLFYMLNKATRSFGEAMVQRADKEREDYFKSAQLGLEQSRVGFEKQRTAFEGRRTTIAEQELDIRKRQEELDKYKAGLSEQELANNKVKTQIEQQQADIADRRQKADAAKQQFEMDAEKAWVDLPAAQQNKYGGDITQQNLVTHDYRTRTVDPAAKDYWGQVAKLGAEKGPLMDQRAAQATSMLKAINDIQAIDASKQAPVTGLFSYPMYLLGKVTDAFHMPGIGSGVYGSPGGAEAETAIMNNVAQALAQKMKSGSMGSYNDNMVDTIQNQLPSLWNTQGGRQKIMDMLKYGQETELGVVKIFNDHTRDGTPPYIPDKNDQNVADKTNKWLLQRSQTVDPATQKRNAVESGKMPVSATGQTSVQPMDTSMTGLAAMTGQTDTAAAPPATAPQPVPQPPAVPAPQPVPQPVPQPPTVPPVPAAPQAAPQTAPQAQPQQGPVGMIAPGNIDLANRPIVKNPDGTISTVRSIGINVNGKEVLIPTVASDGSGILSNEDAIKQYQRTGQNLGTFDTPEHSNQYARQLHEAQAAQYAPQNASATSISPSIKEPAGDVRAQFQSLLDPKSSKDAIFLSPENEQDIPANLPTGVRKVKTPAGILITTNDKKAEQFRNNPSDDTLANVLGYPTNKVQAVASGNPVVVKGTNADGNTIVEAVVSPDAVGDAHGKFKEQIPPDGKIVITSPEQAVADRAAAVAKESGPASEPANGTIYDNTSTEDLMKLLGGGGAPTPAPTQSAGGGIRVAP